MNNPDINIQKLRHVYSVLRLIIAFIWIWSALVSWLIFPQEDSLGLLRQVGLVDHTQLWFSASCLLDVVLGALTLFYPSKLLWRAQIVLILFYSVVVAIGLPAFLVHPFAPIVKNLAVLGCLYHLLIFDDCRTQSLNPKRMV